MTRSWPGRSPRTGCDYVTAAGWIAPQEYAQVEVGRYRTVAVPLYRVGDLDAVRELADVDWEAVRPGEPSPLREWARKPPTRDQVIRRFVGELGDRHDIEVWAMYHPGRDQWELDWERLDGDCELTAAAVEAAIGADPVVSQYAADITLDTEASAAIRWARAMLGPGAAVILDTETTDLHGSVCEIAVIEAATGDVLLDTLVNPETPITAGAQRIHGISDEDVAGAPTWPEVLPRLLDITQGHTVLAYNAEYDAGVIAADTRQHGLELGHLGDDDRWGCVMLRRSDWLGRYRRFALGGGHRALDDTLAALDVLRRMTAPR